MSCVEKNIHVDETAKIGNNVVIKGNSIIGSNVVIEDDVLIDYNVIIRDNVTIKKGTSVGAGCVIGEYTKEFYDKRDYQNAPLEIGEKSIIRSGSVIYAGSVIGESFQTGHHVTIREKSTIGKDVSVGTLSDIQGNCSIGNYVRMHSNVHIGQLSKVDDFVWIYPYVVLTNDPTPPSENFAGVHIHSYAIIATGSIIMPGIEIKEDTLVGAGAIVTKDVEQYSVVAGNPARQINDVRNIKSKFTGEPIYPWRYHFDRYMPWEGIGFDKWQADR